MNHPPFHRIHPYTANDVRQHTVGVFSWIFSFASARSRIPLHLPTPASHNKPALSTTRGTKNYRHFVPGIQYTRCKTAGKSHWTKGLSSSMATLCSRSALRTWKQAIIIAVAAYIPPPTRWFTPTSHRRTAAVHVANAIGALFHYSHTT